MRQNSLLVTEPLNAKPLNPEPVNLTTNLQILRSPQGSLQTIGNIYLTVNVIDVGFDSVHADKKFFRNLSAAVS